MDFYWTVQELGEKAKSSAVKWSLFCSKRICRLQVSGKCFFFLFFSRVLIGQKKYKFGNSNFDISAASLFTRNDRKNYRFVPISTHFYSQVVCCSGTSSKFRTLSSSFQGDILTIFIYRAWSDSNLGRIVWNTKVLTTRIQEACLNITYCPNFRKWSSS